jgi:hypothetical protein
MARKHDSGRGVAADGVSRASLRADVVYRDPGQSSRTVLAFPRHLEQPGFTGAPREMGDGFAPTAVRWSATSTGRAQLLMRYPEQPVDPPHLRRTSRRVRDSLGAAKAVTTSG